MARAAGVKSKKALTDALRKGKTQAGAAKILGVSAAAVRRAMDRYGVKRPKAGKPKPKKIAWSEKQLRAVMLKTGWDMGRAAELLGVAEETVARQLAKHGVRERRKKIGRPSVVEVIGAEELAEMISQHRGNRTKIRKALGITYAPTLDKLVKDRGLAQLDCWVRSGVTKERFLRLLQIHKGDRQAVADQLCIHKGTLGTVSKKYKITGRGHKPGWTYVPQGRKGASRKMASPVRRARGEDVHALMGASVSEATGRASGVLTGRRGRVGMSRAESIRARQDPAYLWLKEEHGISMPVAGNPRQRFFRVRSPAQGLKAIEDPVITGNYKKALAHRPKHRRAVLVPCAGTKPFPDAPSHRDGYLRALEGKAVDVFVVSEPLGVVPYAWSRDYPQTHYDFPPRHLRGAARDLLVERIAYWLCAVGKKYSEVVAALPEHHARLVDDALTLCEPIRKKVKWAGIGECLDDGVCPPGHYRPTSRAYRGYLKARANPPVRHNGFAISYCERCWDETAPGTMSRLCDRCERAVAQELAEAEGYRLASNPCPMCVGAAMAGLWAARRSQRR
jgi:DNA-binding protein Fis